MAILSKTEILALDVRARLELIEELWDSIERDHAAARQMPPTEAERVLIEQRLGEYRANPASGRPWDEVRAEILKRR